MENELWSLKLKNHAKYHMLNHFIELWPHYWYLRDLWPHYLDVNDRVYKAAPSLCLQRQKKFQWQSRTWLARCQEWHLPNCDKLGCIAESRWHVFSRHLTTSNSYLRHKLPCNTTGNCPHLQHLSLLMPMSQFCLLSCLNQTAFLDHFKYLTNSISKYRIRD